MQLDDTYLDAVSYLRVELSKLNLLDTISTQIASHSGGLGIGAAVESVRSQFPGISDAVSRFDIGKLEEALQKAISAHANSSGDIITIPELAVFQQQVGFLQEMRRYIARRKSTRVSRVVAAAHRRTTLAAIDGKVTKSLLLHPESVLTKLRG